MNGLHGKGDVRTAMRHRRATLTAGDIEDWSARIRDTLCALPEFRAARTVCCYLTIAGEVLTDDIIAECRRTGKTVCVPAFKADTGSYEPAELVRGGRLVEGPARVLQPDAPRWLSFDGVDLLVVPGVAYDVECRRLGRGGGHYDRILARTRGIKAGVAFDFQVVDRLEEFPHDVRMDLVVTERRIIRPAGHSHEGGMR